MILNYLKSNSAKLGDELRLNPSNVRIFANCFAPRHDFSGKIKYMFENMYLDDLWVYI